MAYVYDDNDMKELHETMKREANAIPVDRHAKVLLDELIKIACLKEYGVPYINRKKIKEREMRRIGETISQELKKRYGKYANLKSIRCKNGFIDIADNLIKLYKTPGGWIYGPFAENLEYVFFNTHSIERYEERVNPKFLEIAKKGQTALNGSVPSTLDILALTFINGIRAGIEFAWDEDGSIFINVRQGVVVFNILKEKIFIAKTFLTPEMLKAVQWFQTDLDAITENMPLHEQLKHFYKIDKPCFFEFNKIGNKMLDF